MPSNLPKQIENSVTNFASLVESCVEQWKSARDPAAFRQMELEVAAETRALADEISAYVLRAIARDPEMQAEASVAVRRAHPGKYRHGGRRRVTVTLLGGKRVTLEVEYLKLNRRKSRKKHRNGNRGKGGTGLYPVLAALCFCGLPLVFPSCTQRTNSSIGVRTPTRPGAGTAGGRAGITFCTTTAARERITASPAPSGTSCFEHTKSRVWYACRPSTPPRG